jgi:hypothetical protein
LLIDIFVHFAHPPKAENDGMLGTPVKLQRYDGILGTQ